MSKVFTNKAAWGDSIQWVDFDRRRVVGHSTPVPSIGDFLDCKMQSGKVARFKFEIVERCGDPADMFFARMSDVGYVTENCAEIVAGSEPY